MDIASFIFFATGLAVLWCAARLVQRYLHARSRRSLHTLIAIVAASAGMLVLFTGRTDGPGLEIGPHAKPFPPTSEEGESLPTRVAASVICLAIAAGAWLSRADTRQSSSDRTS